MATLLAHSGFWGAGLVVLRRRFGQRASAGTCPLGVPGFWGTQSVPHSVLVSTQPCDREPWSALGCAWLEGSHEGQLLPWQGRGGRGPLLPAD